MTVCAQLAPIPPLVSLSHASLASPALPPGQNAASVAAPAAALLCSSHLDQPQGG